MGKECGDETRPVCTKKSVKSLQPPAKNNSKLKTETQFQNYKELRKKFLENGGLFEDPEFPCKASSIFNLKKRRRGIKWKRPKDITDDPKFFVGDESRFDIQEGKLGNSWLSAAMASLTLNKKLFDKVVPHDQTFDEGEYCGLFHFKFWQFGKWVDIFVDDRLPTKNGKLLYISSSQTNEFWGALMEKAYAKLYGSYEALLGGSAYEAMEDFTGGLAETFDLSENEESNLFRIILKAYERESLMCCFTKRNPKDSKLKTVTKEGLIEKDAYSITGFLCHDTVKSGNVPLIRLKTPSCEKPEWNGAWSDMSSEWTSILDSKKKSMGLTLDNDGEFWMSFDDFLKYFDRLEICNLNPITLTEGKIEWKTNVFENEWIRGVSAGGCLNHRTRIEETPPTFANNPQYSLVVTDADEDDLRCNVIVALMQKHRRTRGMENLHIGFAIYHLKDSNHPKELLNTNFFKENKPREYLREFVNAREVIGRFSLAPGVYCIVLSTFGPDEEGDFILRVFSEKRHRMIKIYEEFGIVETNDKRELENEDQVEKECEDIFHQVSGGDHKIDWKELQSLLNTKMKKDLLDNEESADHHRNCLTEIGSSVIKFFFGHTCVGQVLGNRDLVDAVSGCFCWFLRRTCKANCGDSSLAYVCEREKKEFSEDVCRSMIALFDHNNTGKLNLEDFKPLWKDIEKWKTIFKTFDEKETKKLSSHQLRQALTEYKIPNHLLEAFVRRYGNDDFIAFDKFIMCTVHLKTMIEIFRKKDVNNSGEAIFKRDEWLKRTLSS